MFGKLRDPRGRYGLVMAGAACLALAALVLGSAGDAALWPAIGLTAAGAGCLVAWWARRRADPYDLKRLFDEPLPSLDEPEHDTIGPEAAAPYCGWCDEAYPPGTSLCRGCGRKLA